MRNVMGWLVPVGAVIALTVSLMSALPARLIAPAAGQTSVASVHSVTWMTTRRVALQVYSPAMGTSIQVQLLLARDWNIQPQNRFPALIMLDGMRATDIESGWTHDTDAEWFFADKDVTVVLPIGGQSSFYSNWLQSDNGHNYQWETFLTKELPPLLESGWRTTQVRGIAGLSMGGTGAMNIAERNPGFASFVASYSGFLSTTSSGMPAMITLALADVGGFNSAAMWGSPSNPEWAAHDPALHVDKLSGISVYVSSGNGAKGPTDPPGQVPGISSNLDGTALEVFSRGTQSYFAGKLQAAGIPAQLVYRPNGTHSWPYWQIELHDSWPQAAGALRVDAGKAPCGVGGAIGPVVAGNPWLADCTTPEFPIGVGVGQDFRGGRMFWSGQTGAHPIGGMIGGEYEMLGAPINLLGLPSTDELWCPDRRGKFEAFQAGMIYWTPQTKAHAIRGAILGEWANQGHERGTSGYPVADEVATAHKPGAVQGFEGGALYWSAPTGAHTIGGLILGKYAGMGFEDSFLGFPKSNELPLINNGRFNAFEGGNLYWSPASGAWPVRNGPLMDAWAGAGYERGRLGFPVSDEAPIAGGVAQHFQHGEIDVVNGQATIH